jgi:hypothetical protein
VRFTSGQAGTIDGRARCFSCSGVVHFDLQKKMGTPARVKTMKAAAGNAPGKAAAGAGFAYSGRQQYAATAVFCLDRMMHGAFMAAFGPAIGKLTPKFQRVGPEFASWPSSLTGNLEIPISFWPNPADLPFR